MILAFDSYYTSTKAKTVCVTFQNWADAAPLSVYSEYRDEIAEYVPGQFYRRELPCITSLLDAMTEVVVDSIVIDGFVYLDDHLKHGLGGHLYEYLQRRIPVIGVAKTDYHTISRCKASILRGASRKPLFVTAAGISLEQAAENIKSMHGQYRIPTLLKELDRLTKSGDSSEGSSATGLVP